MLGDVPDSVRREYARITVLHRGVDYEEKETTRVMSERPRAYHDALTTLIRDVTNEAAIADDRGVTVPAAAARALGVAES